MKERLIVLKVLGVLLLTLSVFLFLTMGVALYYQEAKAALLISIAVTAFMGAFLFLLGYKADGSHVDIRIGYLVVTMGWLLLALFGSLPFYLSGEIPVYSDAFFETMSGFTTTGASLLDDIEAMPRYLLFWRSLTQWIGGMGIIVLTIAILPLLGIGGMQFFVAETPGPQKDKLTPRIKETAKKLWIIYFSFTLVEVLLLWLAGMSLFDAVNHSLTTMSTGGFSTKQTSIAHWDAPLIHYIITFFMFLGGTSFALSYFVLQGKFYKVKVNEEFRFYGLLILVLSILITAGLFFQPGSGLEASFRDALFQLVSILTTTGYASADYTLWPNISFVLIFLVMFLGASAGSTSGGIKLIRVVLLLKNVHAEFKRVLHPKAVIPVRMNGEAVDPSIVTNVLSFISVYILIFFAGVLALSFLGADLETSLGAVIASLGNIGPGIGDVGPAETYSHFNVASKWILSFLMLVGRLELFTVLLLFVPDFWRK